MEAKVANPWINVHGYATLDTIVMSITGSSIPESGGRTIQATRQIRMVIPIMVTGLFLMA
jgi:hypothetical protein